MPKANVAENEAYQYKCPNIEGHLWVRGPEEEYTAKEQTQYNALVVNMGDIAVDVGAHIGCSARYLTSRGAAHVVAFEPMPTNFEILQRNAEGYNVLPVNMAVTHESGTFTLWTPNTKFSTEHSKVQKKGRVPTEVRGVAFRKVLETYQPQVVKMDIEGGEMDLLEDFKGIHEFAHGIAMEVHYYEADARQKAAQLVTILRQHYEEVQPLRYLEKKWNLDMMVWERK